MDNKINFTAVTDFCESSNSNDLNNDEDNNEYSNTPIVSFGILTDVQYADTDDAHDYTGLKMRYYRNSKNLVHEAVKYWSMVPEDINFQFILQLGDLVDGKCNQVKNQNECLNVILSEFKDFKLYNLWGNHEFYSFKRDELVNTQLNTAKQFNKDVSHEANYYTVDLTKQVRLICLDSYEFSMLGYDESSEVYKKSHELLCQHNKNEDLNSADNLRGHAKRFTKFNGSISNKQLEWLNVELNKCKNSNIKAIICSHVPIHPQACSTTMCLAWNYKDILDMLWSYENTVIAYFSGHDHDGGYFRDKANIHHLTFKAIIETPPNSNSFATIKICNNKVLVEGVGMIQYYEIYF